MTNSDINFEKDIKKQELIDLNLLEISEMEKVLKLINSNEWESVDFCINWKNAEKVKAVIDRFDFVGYIPEKYIVAIKKLIKLGFEEGIKNKKNEINNLK